VKVVESGIMDRYDSAALLLKLTQC